MSDPTDLLRQMAARSERKLRDPKNLAKGDWVEMANMDLVHRVLQEMAELLTALTDGSTWEEIADEAADVYHFASMGADPRRGRPPR